MAIARKRYAQADPAVHLIVKQKDLKHYVGLQDVAKGGRFDFDQVSKGTKGKEGFASVLPLLSKQIATTIGAPEPVAKAPGQPAATAALPELPVGEKIPEPKAEVSPTAPTPQVPQPPQPGKVTEQPVNAPELPKVDAVSPPATDAPTIGSCNRRRAMPRMRVD